MNQFFQTIMGKVFYEGTMPKIAKSLEEIAKEMKRANDLKEQELNLINDELYELKLKQK